MNMLDKKYNHLEVEKDKYEFWLKNDYFKAGTDKSKFIKISPNIKYIYFIRISY